MPVSRINGLTSRITVRNGKPPRRARCDKSDFLTLIQGMKNGQWFIAPKGSAGELLRSNIAPWRAQGVANAYAYKTDGHKIVIINGYMPETTPPKYPQIQDGPPPPMRASRGRMPSPETATLWELLRNTKPGQWFYPKVKPSSVHSIVSRFKKKYRIVFRTFYTSDNKLVVIREPEHKP